MSRHDVIKFIKEKKVNEPDIKKKEMFRDKGRGLTCHNQCRIFFCVLPRALGDLHLQPFSSFFFVMCSYEKHQKDCAGTGL